VDRRSQAGSGQALACADAFSGRVIKQSVAALVEIMAGDGMGSVSQQRVWRVERAAAVAGLQLFQGCSTTAG
jgi:hypothetical protein